jgi:hypothetical protein
MNAKRKRGASLASFEKLPPDPQALRVRYIGGYPPIL